MVPITCCPPGGGGGRVVTAAAQAVTLKLMAAPADRVLMCSHTKSPTKMARRYTQLATKFTPIVAGSWDV